MMLTFILMLSMVIVLVGGVTLQVYLARRKSWLVGLMLQVLSLAVAVYGAISIMGFSLDATAYIRIDRPVPASSDEVSVTSYYAVAEGAREGDSVTYTITVWNNEILDVENVVITETLPEGAAVTVIGDGGVSDGTSVSWGIGNLPAGSAKEVFYTVCVSSAETVRVDAGKKGTQIETVSSFAMPAAVIGLILIIPTASFAAIYAVCRFRIRRKAVQKMSVQDIE